MLKIFDEQANCTAIQGNDMQAAIEARDLRKTYPPQVTALDGLSLYVQAGTIFGLLGPNGAGKSTTVRVLSTLTSPDSGSAMVAGIDVLRQPMQVRKAIGVVGQRHGAAQEATGRENLVLQGELYGITGRELRERVRRSLDRFDLAKAADRQVRTYSGGMQRRLDIAMGLLHAPKVLFLDEPTTGLDPESRAELWLEVQRLAREEQMSILLTTHYMEEADRLASQVAIVDHGQIVAQGSPQELKSELKGDKIEVEIAEGGQPRAREALSKVSDISEVELDGLVLHAIAADGAAALPAALAALEAHEVSVRSATISRPSLDDVYLRHAGHVMNGSVSAATAEAAA
jgi:ABC-2 type transport system ATP-binding protein